MKPTDTPTPQVTGRAVSRAASFGHALRGLRVLLRQPNARIHAVAAVVVVALGWRLQISVNEWLAVVLAVALVVAAEALNTALELVVDLVSPQWHALARDAKDVAAAAVLVCSAGAAVVGVWVFGPKLLGLL
jgi:diacylglycerol kinase